ncbi:MAG TPA: DUF711 family protein [Chloroflexota bacterium]|nr:DUF711 family protein [Chloroflexota bacterium]
MKVRALTAFQAADERSLGEVVDDAARLLRNGRRILDENGFEVQTVRLAVSARPVVHGGDLVGFARDVEAACQDAGVEYVSLGPIPVGRLDAAPDVIAATSAVFVSANVTGERGIDLRAIDAAAGVIRRIASLGADGFGNLRFAAIARCPPHIPFFPAAYHDGGPPAFGVALQAADLVNDAVRDRPSLVDAPARIAATFDRAVAPLDEQARRIAKRRGHRYLGVDVSPAPFPDDVTSLAGAIETLSGTAFGGRGTVSAAAAIVQGIRQTKVQRCGFSGLMLPVLEDAVLARRSVEGTFGLDDLLLCAAVCGLGLDTVPLPGDAPAEGLAQLIGEVATMAVRLEKPLTARLFPIPGKAAGDVAAFDFPYFADGRVLPLES